MKDWFTKIQAQVEQDKIDDKEVEDYLNQL